MIIRLYISESLFIMEFRKIAFWDLFYFYFFINDIPISLSNTKLALSVDDIKIEILYLQNKQLKLKSISQQTWDEC